ncbi:DUF3138 family protein [Piscinibacter sp. Jin2]|uniref:DUF3138 family protein n=1 Tax=Aquariibacter lacus TaxID=2801332 RepID=A0A9X1BQR1_9BURK|nr:DUF3138 family protein [Piscinibacter lacus]MBL0719941.1 DUF3138 family protein [Piscinibacter lacus]
MNRPTLRALPRTLLLALATAYPLMHALPAAAQSASEELLKELRELKARVGELEKRLIEAETKAKAAPAAAAPAGMTAEQQQDFNRIAVKTEAMEDNIETWGIKGLTISGYIEPVFIYNRNQDRAGFQFLNSQSDGYFYDTSFMGAASIDFTKETESGTRFKLTLTPQRGVGEAIGGGIVQEATVSIPLSDLQTRLIVGQVPDWSGYEYQQPTLNPFTTHNLLYDFTLPFGYTGVGLDVTRGKWWMRGILGQLNLTTRGAGEKSPMVAYRVDYSRGEFQGFGFAGVHGRVFNFGTGTNTTAHLFEIDGYFIRGDWTVQGQFSYGQQADAAINGGDSRWYGVSALAGYSITPRLQALVRADYLENSKNGGGFFGFSSPDGRNGIGPGVEGFVLDEGGAPLEPIFGTRGADRYALTLGLKYLFNQNTTFKAEYRFDGASERVFEDVRSGGFKKNNHLLGGSVVVFF